MLQEDVIEIPDGSDSSHYSDCEAEQEFVSFRGITRGGVGVVICGMRKKKTMSN